MVGEVVPSGADGGAVHRFEMRASHEDRDRIVEQVRHAGGDGRLDPDELGERLDAALVARTLGDLAALVRDLPADGHNPVPLRANPASKDLVRVECGSASIRRTGPWVVPRRMEVRVSSGSITLDLTQAQLSQPMLHIDASVRSGRLRLVTRPGITVDADDVSVGSGEVKVRAPWGPEVPVYLHVTVSGSVRSGSIVVGPPRRNFWQWLMRRPRPYALPRA